MSTPAMTSLERVLTTLGHQEPDRVPLFLLLTMHGAKELGMSIRDYFSRADHVAEGQLRLREKYQHDCYYSFFYAPLEVEAWGGDVLYVEDGPPNSGQPFIQHPSQIEKLTVPDMDTPCLQKVLDATATIKKEMPSEAPIIGVVMSPFSLPVMQLGFPAYLDLIYQQPDLFSKLMEINQDFCVAWANAQLDAGATAICYFDPVSSPTIIDRALYQRTGQPVARETLARINGPTATHLASGRSLPIVDDVAATGSAVISATALESLADMKTASRNKLTVLGNLNGIEMARWSPEEARAKVTAAIAAAAPGGGFILSDNHGEIPWQVSDEILMTISETVRESGTYPLLP
ncbi:MAG: methylcobamide--CoM methyltransferase MtbA [Desulfuromonas sp.]|nr:MAG: methylcobamide--CoM methyltransferase MtbA [Desulfuromonas sp.]